MNRSLFLRSALGHSLQSLALAAIIAASVKDARAQNFGGSVIPNGGGGNSVGMNTGATINSAVANGPSVDAGIAGGMNGISANRVGPYGVAPNAAQLAPTVPNPAVVNGNVNPNVNFNTGGAMNGYGGAYFGGNQVPFNQNGAWMYFYGPQSGYGGAGTWNGNSQTFGQYNGYAGRTFARGNPSYFGVQRFYANGRNSAGYQGWGVGP